MNESEIMSELEWHRRLRALAQEREPTRDLWPGIAQRIALSSAPRRTWRRDGWVLGLAAAASVVIAVVMAIAMRPMLLTDPPSTTPVSATPASEVSLQRQVDAMTLEYVAALDALSGPQVSPVLVPALAELDITATQLRAALREEPSATFLVDQLRRTYAQRLKLTQRALIHTV